jgi:hypothetical protein
MIISLRATLRHFDNRISEAVKAVIMIGIAMQIAVVPHAQFPALRLLERSLSQDGVFCLFLFVGVVRLAALIANGHWPNYGPWMRAIGALIGALIWSNMFLSVVALMPPELTSLGAPIFFVFSVVELLSIYRALAMRARYGSGV